MAWIESHQHLEKNGKLLEFANTLGINKYQAIGHLHALWWWALDNAEDGNIQRFSNATVTQACGWTEYIKDEEDLSQLNHITNKDRYEDFMPALIDCGFLDKREDGLWIHNWGDYTDRYFKSVKQKKRILEQTRLRVEKHRNGNANVTQVKRDVTVPTIPNLTKPIRDREAYPQVPYKSFLNCWNETATRLPKCQSLSEGRKKKVAARWKEKPDSAYWQETISRLNASDFATGTNDRGWVASLDWLISNDTNHVKVNEGKYDNREAIRLPQAVPQHMV